MNGNAPRGAAFAVWVLTAINLLNYIDRWMPAAIKELFKKDLRLTDAQTSLPLTAFVVVYMLASPVFGALEGRFARKGLIALGVLLWSLATGLAGLAAGFASFLLLRSLVGIGEAAYGTLSPPLLADFYPAERRNRILTLFYVAIPVGSALGFALGGILGTRFGWRYAFMACGFPGLLCGLLVLLIREPPRGAQDHAAEKTAGPPAWPEALRSLARNREYLFAVAGYTAVTFAAGAMGDWFPAFLSRFRGLSIAEAGVLVSAVTVLGGLGGTVLGGALADALRGRTRNPYFCLSAVSMVAATGFTVLALLLRGRVALSACMFLAQLFLWFYNGPINATLVNCVPGRLRARAFSLSILSIHLLGDAVSPSIVGLISDRAGDLRAGLLLIPIMLGVGTLIWAAAWRLLPAPADARGTSAAAGGPAAAAAAPGGPGRT